jgi:hypothetical protein
MGCALVSALRCARSPRERHSNIIYIMRTSRTPLPLPHSSSSSPSSCRPRALFQYATRVRSHLLPPSQSPFSPPPLPQLPHFLVRPFQPSPLPFSGARGAREAASRLSERGGLFHNLRTHLRPRRDPRPAGGRQPRGRNRRGPDEAGGGPGGASGAGRPHVPRRRRRGGGTAATAPLASPFQLHVAQAPILLLRAPLRQGAAHGHAHRRITPPCTPLPVSMSINVHAPKLPRGWRLCATSPRASSLPTR